MTPDSSLTTPSPAPDRAGRREFLHHISGLVLLGCAGARVPAMPRPGVAIPATADPGAADPADTLTPGASAPWEELSDPGWSQ